MTVQVQQVRITAALQGVLKELVEMDGSPEASQAAAIIEARLSFGSEASRLLGLTELAKQLEVPYPWLLRQHHRGLPLTGGKTTATWAMEWIRKNPEKGNRGSNG